MQLGMVGLGRMGANLVRRLMRDGHECVVFDVNADAVTSLAAEGATGASSLEDFVGKLTEPRVAWIMVPAAFAGQTVTEVAALMSRGDIVIDGGNTYYRDDMDRAAALLPQGVHYVDIGTSGGVFGLERGFCLMIGGETDIVKHLDPLLRTIAPGVDAAPRTAGASGEPSTAEQGYLHCGPAGAGHFVKMVHNGIEYGMMAAYAEGLNVLHHANVGNRTKCDLLERRRDDWEVVQIPDAVANLASSVQLFFARTLNGGRIGKTPMHVATQNVEPIDRSNIRAAIRGEAGRVAGVLDEGEAWRRHVLPATVRVRETHFGETKALAQVR